MNPDQKQFESALAVVTCCALALIIVVFGALIGGKF